MSDDADRELAKVLWKKLDHSALGSDEAREIIAAALAEVRHEAKLAAVNTCMEAARASLNCTHKKRHLNGYNSVLHSIADAFPELDDDGDDE